MIPENADVLLDTNVLVHVIRLSPLGERLLNEFNLLVRVITPTISYVTLAELYAFGRKNGWGEQKLQFIETIRMNLLVAPIERNPILHAYAELDAFAEENGKSIGKNDLWIAATAKVMEAHLLTTDKDFKPLRELLPNLVLIEQETGAVIE